MVYIVATFFSTIIAIISQLNFKTYSFCGKPNKLLFAISAVPYILVLALRDGVGTDYYGVYVNGYNAITNNFSSRFELGFVIICKLCALFSHDYHVMFAFVSTITVVLCYIAIYRISANAALSVYLIAVTGYLMASTNLIRQTLALAIFLNAIPYLTSTSRNVWKYSICVILASTIHSSAILLILLYPLVTIALDIKKIFLLLAISIVFSNVLVSLVGRMAALFSNQLAIYFNQATEYSGSGNIDFSDLGYCLILIASFVYLSVLAQRDKIREDSNVYSWLIFAGIICAILSNVMFIFSRAAIYFTYCGILAFPYFVKEIKKYSKRDSWILSVIMLFMMTCLTIYLYGVLRFSHAIPYYSVI